MKRASTVAVLLLTLAPALAAPLVTRTACRDLSFGAAGITHQPRTVTLARTATPPVLDGKLDEACWQAAPPLTPFVLRDQDHPALVQTQVRVLFDDTRLYLAFRCDEPSPAKLRADHMERDSDIWRDDDIEIFLCPNDDHHTYYQLMVNSRGGLADARFEGSMRQVATDWNAPWEIKTAVGADHYSVEIAVPFSAFGLPGAIPGSRWCGNFCRTRYVGGMELSTWTRPGFHDPAAFAELEFGPAPVTARLRSVGRLAWGRNEAVVEVANTTGQPVALKAEVLVDGQEALLSPPPPVPAGGGPVTLSYRVPQAGLEQTLSLRLANPSGKPALRVERRFEPPHLLAFRLAERRLFVGQDRVLATARVALPPEELKTVRLRVSLRQTATATPLRSTVLEQLTGGEVHLLLDVSRLAAGAYLVQAELLDQAQQPLEQTTEELHVRQGPF